MRLSFHYVIIVMFFLVLSSCDKESDIKPKSSTTTSKISKPTVSIASRKANSNYDGWWVIADVTTGGDDPANITCDLEWAIFPQKQSGTVTLNHKSSMKVSTSSKSKVRFKGEHAGLTSGHYIYFRCTGRNSKYSSSTSISYMVATDL